MDRLETMFSLQHEMQTKTYGADPAELEGAERVQFVKDMTLALTDELHEALAEVAWKPWSTSEHFNEAAFQGEMVDAFHFFMNLCIVGKLDPQLLFEKYTEKRMRNIQRQIAGYTGLDKCPNCKRAFDDIDAIREKEANLQPGQLFAHTRYRHGDKVFCGVDCAREYTNA